jgi:dimethylargininase
LAASTPEDWITPAVLATGNDTVLIDQGFPKTAALLRGLGYNVAPIDMSEYRKMDGGLSCLSLRW